MVVMKKIVTHFGLTRKVTEKCCLLSQEETKLKSLSSAEINSITDIDQMAMTFLGDITLTIEWRDWRIKFKDLKENGNYLNKYWQNEIWLPPLYFSNTIGNVPILIDDSKTVKILRQGESIYNDVSELNEGHIFSGEENGLQLKTQYEQTFKCLFELSKFPFDTQYCTMNIKIPQEIRNYTQLKTKTLTYSGSNTFVLVKKLNI